MLSATQTKVSSWESASSDEIISDVQGFRVVDSLLVSAVATLAYDYTLTISDEIQFVWQRSLGPYTFLYYIIRYLPLCEAAIFLAEGYIQAPSSFACHFLYSAASWLYYIGVFSALGALIFRTYVIYDRSKRIARSLIILLASLAGVAGYFLGENALSARFSSGPSPSILPGCYAIAGKNTQWVCYVILIVYETVILALTLWKIVRRKGGGPLYRTIYRNGISFYIFLLVASIVNLVFFNAAPVGLKYSFVPFHQILHAILSGRLLLNIRSTLIDGERWYFYLADDAERGDG